MSEELREKSAMKELYIKQAKDLLEHNGYVVLSADEHNAGAVVAGAPKRSLYDDQRMFTIRELSELWNVRYLTVYRWVRNGLLDSNKLGGQYRISDESRKDFENRTEFRAEKWPNH